MTISYKIEQLRRAILPLSRSSDWAAACREWTLVDMEWSEDWSACPCTTPIKELCTIANSHTGSRIIVGNKCVHKFMGINSAKIFKDVIAIYKDIAKALGADATAFFSDKGFFNPWERKFLIDTRTKLPTRLSKKQFKIRLKINYKLLEHMRFPKEKLDLQDEALEKIYNQLR